MAENMTRATEEQNFKFYLILINLYLNVNDHKWLVATIWIGQS